MNIEEFDDLWDLTEDDDFSSEVLPEFNNDDLFVRQCLVFAGNLGRFPVVQNDDIVVRECHKSL